MYSNLTKEETARIKKRTLDELYEGLNGDSNYEDLRGIFTRATRLFLRNSAETLAQMAVSSEDGQKEKLIADASKCKRLANQQ